MPVVKALRLSLAPAAVCGSVGISWASQGLDLIPDRPPFHRSLGLPLASISCLLLAATTSWCSALRLFRCFKSFLTLSPHAALKLVPPLPLDARPRPESPSPSCPALRSLTVNLDIFAITFAFWFVSLPYLHIPCTHPKTGLSFLFVVRPPFSQPPPSRLPRRSTLSASNQLRSLHPTIHHNPTDCRPPANLQPAIYIFSPTANPRPVA